MQSNTKNVVLVALYNAIFSFFNSMVTVERIEIMLSNKILKSYGWGKMIMFLVYELIRGDHLVPHTLFADYL